MFGKAGRAETATDPAPLEMFETTIQFKPRDQWRAGHDARQAGRGARPHGARCPGSPTSGCRRSATASTCWPPASRARSASRWRAPTSPTIDRLAAQIERVVKKVPGVSSALAERLTGGRYIDVDIDRAAAARYGLNVADVQRVVSSAIGGENVGETVEGLQRFPINVRYPREMRDSLEKLRELPVRDRARRADPPAATSPAIAIERRPADAEERERAALGLGVRRRARPRPALRGARHAARPSREQVKLPPGYSISWSGQFEYLERATRAAEDRRAGDAGRSSSCCSTSPSAASTRRC